jgi:hypothetical protein
MRAATYFTTDDFSDTDVERFWNKVAIGDPHECWEWQAAKRGNGYGYFTLTRERYSYLYLYAHRIAFTLTHRTLDTTEEVLHACDNPRCVNPNHLSAGSQKENMEQAQARGRTTRGEKHHFAKLTEQEVMEIKRRLQNGESQRAIAADYGVTGPTISRINTGSKWSHVT